MSSEPYKETDKFITKIIQTLEKESEILNQETGVFQKNSTLRQGLIYYKGIYRNLDSIDHSILFDHYEILILRSFLSLYRNLFEKKESIFTEFAFRTLVETGFYRNQILFGDSINPEEKRHFKLLLTLVDYGLLAKDSLNNANRCQKLFNENEKLLTDKEKKVIRELISNLSEKDFKKHMSLVRKLRHLIGVCQNRLYVKTKILPEFNEEALREMFSGYSHFLHGDALLISDLFSPKRDPQRHTLRVYWFLLLAGYNVAIHVSQFLQKKEINALADELKNEFISISINLKNLWTKGRSQKKDFHLRDFRMRV